MKIDIAVLQTISTPEDSPYRISIPYPDLQAKGVHFRSSNYDYDFFDWHFLKNGDKCFLLHPKMTRYEIPYDELAKRNQFDIKGVYLGDNDRYFFLCSIPQESKRKHVVLKNKFGQNISYRILQNAGIDPSVQNFIFAFIKGDSCIHVAVNHQEIFLIHSPAQELDMVNNIQKEIIKYPNDFEFYRAFTKVYGGASFALQYNVDQYLYLNKESTGWVVKQSGKKELNSQGFCLIDEINIENWFEQTLGIPRVLKIVTYNEDKWIFRCSSNAKIHGLDMFICLDGLLVSSFTKDTLYTVLKPILKKRLLSIIQTQNPITHILKGTPND